MTIAQLLESPNAVEALAALDNLGVELTQYNTTDTTVAKLVSAVEKMRQRFIELGVTVTTWPENAIETNPTG